MTPLDSLRHRTGRADSPGDQTGRADSPGDQTGRADSPGDQTGRADSPMKEAGSLVRKGEKMYYVYVLRSEKDGNFYVGFTCDLDRRLREHNNGENLSTSYRRPFVLVYFEVCFDGRDAVSREKYLKSSWGKRYIKGRIKNYMIRHQVGQGVKNG